MLLMPLNRGLFWKRWFWKSAPWLALTTFAVAWSGVMSCTRPSSCAKDKDCRSGEFCQSGVCQKQGEGRETTEARAEAATNEAREGSQETNLEAIRESEPCPSSVCEGGKEKGAEGTQEKLEDRAEGSKESEATLGEDEPPLERATELPREREFPREARDGGEGIAEARPESVPEKPKKAYGERCTQHSECAQNFCVIPIGFPDRLCTFNCKEDKDCGTEVCRKTPGVGGFCYPRCKTTADCASKAPLSHCVSEGHCWPLKGVGETCTTNTECQASLICKDPDNLGKKICTKPCTSLADCATGFWCEQHDPMQGGYCIPLCKTTSDCRPYTSMPWCNLEYHCWRSFIEDMLQCRVNQECLSLTCVAPAGLGFTICTRECQVDLDCEIGFLCHRQMAGQKGYCMRVCASADDCKQDISTPVCKNGICWKTE